MSSDALIAAQAIMIQRARLISNAIAKGLQNSFVKLSVGLERGNQQPVPTERAGQVVQRKILLDYGMLPRAIPLPQQFPYAEYSR
jgi:hypothetical protein